MNKIFSFLLLVIFTNSILFAECDTQILENIQTKIKEKRTIVDKFTVCKKWPYKKDTSIVVMTFFNKEMTEQAFDMGLADYDVYTIVYNTKTNTIQNQLYQEALYTSDAIYLDKLIIDTARYNVSKYQRAFGIRSVHYSSSRVNPLELSELNLYIIDKKSLKSVLKTTVVDNGGEWDGNCNGEFYNLNSVISVSNNKTNEFFDLKLRRTSINSKAIEKTNECLDIEGKPTYQTMIYKYDGKSYKVQK